MQSGAGNTTQRAETCVCRPVGPAPCQVRECVRCWGQQLQTVVNFMRFLTLLPPHRRVVPGSRMKAATTNGVPVHRGAVTGSSAAEPSPSWHAAPEVGRLLIRPLLQLRAHKCVSCLLYPHFVTFCRCSWCRWQSAWRQLHGCPLVTISPPQSCTARQACRLRSMLTHQCAGQLRDQRGM